MLQKARSSVGTSPQVKTLAICKVYHAADPLCLDSQTGGDNACRCVMTTAQYMAYVLGLYGLVKQAVCAPISCQNKPVSSHTADGKCSPVSEQEGDQNDFMLLLSL